MIVALAALVIALALASLAVSVYALLSAHKLFYAAKLITEAVRAECAATAETARSQCNALAEELRAVKAQTAAGILPQMPKAGMNLTRRTHALRLHRKGSSPEHIAACLDVPSQEVNLLIKVHEIVLNNL